MISMFISLCVHNNDLYVCISMPKPNQFVFKTIETAVVTINSAVAVSSPFISAPVQFLVEKIYETTFMTKATCLLLVIIQNF